MYTQISLTSICRGTFVHCSKFYSLTKKQIFLVAKKKAAKYHRSLWKHVISSILQNLNIDSRWQIVEAIKLNKNSSIFASVHCANRNHSAMFALRAEINSLAIFASVQLHQFFQTIYSLIKQKKKIQSWTHRASGEKN